MCLRCLTSHRFIGSFLRLTKFWIIHIHIKILNHHLPFNYFSYFQLNSKCVLQLSVYNNLFEEGIKNKDHWNKYSIAVKLFWLKHITELQVERFVLTLVGRQTFCWYIVVRKCPLHGFWLFNSNNLNHAFKRKLQTKKTIFRLDW